MLLMLRAAMKHTKRYYDFPGASHQKLSTSDASRLHIRRVHFQEMIWKQAHLTNFTLPLPETMGWSRLNDQFVPKLMSLAPVPESCHEIKKLWLQITMQSNEVWLPECRTNMHWSMQLQKY